MNERLTIDNEVLLGEICKLLSKGKRIKLRAKGDSMRPSIIGGDDILILAPATQLRKYDVVLARVGGKGIEGERNQAYRYVIHRIIRIKEACNRLNVEQNKLNDERDAIMGEWFTLMGDGNLYAEEKCCRADIFGIVESIVRGGKERSLASRGARFRAIAWRSLLPLRRLRSKISNLKIKFQTRRQNFKTRR